MNENYSDRENESAAGGSAGGAAGNLGGNSARGAGREAAGDREMERLLQAMPLRRPEHLPAELGQLLHQEVRASADGHPPGGSSLRRITGFRVPLWAAAAAAVVLLTLQAGISNLMDARQGPVLGGPGLGAPVAPGAAAATAARPPAVRDSQLADLARLPAAANRQFWTVDDLHQVERNFGGPVVVSYEYGSDDYLSPEGSEP